MSSTGSIDFSPLDSSTCRILTVASTLEHAAGLVDRVRNLRKVGQVIPTPEASTSALVSTEPTHQPHESGLGESIRIPWTLSNKYYSADVHFAAHTIAGLSPHIVRNVPAVVFVWSKGEAYKHHVERLAGDMSGYEPEVALAVRLAPSGVPEADSEDDDEDEAEIDEFLSSNGFEFVDASEELSSPEEDEESRPFSQGIPGLPRVLDALSTIMWPSMQVQAKPKSSGLPTLARRDFDWAQNSRDDLSPLGGLVRGANKQQELEVLTRWLEEDDGVSPREDPWRSAADSAAVSASPTGMTTPHSIFPDGATEFGFDDDFTVFVSAPPVEDTKGQEEEDVEDDSFDSPRLGLPDASPLYLSLGSALDLREVEEEKVEPARDEDDEDLPNDAEIEAMSSRIFGGPVRSKTVAESKSHAPIPDAVPLDADTGLDEEYDMAPFDLSRVMSALEGMKAEIASMEDEGERRKAAAKVALGLVYGLEADAGIEDL
ncbi:hypothetical protein B0H17DRAFT_1054969 [Mycena rosella]|uniref:Uncharacterized protein n=1 Tax=Mycena rosella TaxID=1033263 RepID=A0AAD7DNS3_MYCRO|nr:hypothetical protein B0H17DRAFT_1054969 [Mycena rosella]